MYKFLEEAFWHDELIVTREQVERMIRLIEDQERPVSETALAEFLVREVLEREQEFATARIYSPEQKFRVGERLVFIHEKGAKYAEVKQVTSAGGSGGLGIYEKIYVQFKGEGGWRTYVADCPRFPLRFAKRPPGEADKDAGTGFITPGQLVTQFGELILVEMRRALLEDGRCIYHDEKWYLANGVVAMNLDLAEQFLRKSRRPMPAEAIISELFPGKQHERNPAIYLFSINLALDKDNQRRFARHEKDGTSLWRLQAEPPPERSRYTVTEAALREGYIEVRSGLRQMLAFYELGPRLIFTVYGGYQIEGEVDDATNRVYGADIACWYMENEVQPGSIVHIKAPETGGKILRLYTEDHERRTNRDPFEVDRDTRRVFFRHRIYRFFVEHERFMHYRSLAEQLSSSIGETISAESVAAVLSGASHLFGKLGPSRGLWGLREWLTPPYDFRVDLTSLLLDIGELQLVYKILGENCRPMHAREIADVISGAYGISPRLLIEANFIDPQDSRLLRLATGRWALIEWKEQWQQRLYQIDKEVEKIEEFTRRLHEQQLRLSQADHSIVLMRTQEEEKAKALPLLIEEQDELVRQAKQLKERMNDLEADGPTFQRQEEQALVELGKRIRVKRQQLAIALCGAAASPIFWAMGPLALPLSIAALSVIPLCVARKAHSMCGKLSSLVSTLRLKRRDLEHKVRAFRREVETLEQDVETGTQELEAAREELGQCREALANREQRREEMAVLVSTTEAALSGYDRAALLIEREQLSELMGEVHW